MTTNDIDLEQTPLVETEWLAAHMDKPGLRIIDARWRGDGTSSRALYEAGHIPGAVHLDWQFDLAHTDEQSGLRYMLRPPQEFAEIMSQAGISDDTPVIAYADYDYSGATRLWWALNYYGHTQVAVLNGGYNKWLAEQRPTTTDLPNVSPTKFTPRPQSRWIATADQIKQSLADQNTSVRLVDTRPPEQYAGQAVWTPPGSFYLPETGTAEIGARRAMRAGHIPGAVNITSSTNLNPTDWTFLPVEKLREKAQAAGLEGEQSVITYCGVGISASLGLFALRLAGFEKLALYEASWEEWGTDPTLPIEVLP